MAKQYKRAARATRSPTTRDLEWSAGFIEGEGSFDIDRGRGRVCAVQVNREPLEKLLALFGGHIYTRRPTEGWGKQPVCSWIVTGPRARGVMMTLYSLMSERRQRQILCALGRG